MRGLKHKGRVQNVAQLVVAPYVGAWIETQLGPEFFRVKPVAPYVGAWIETDEKSATRFTTLSRTLRGCVD